VHAGAEAAQRDRVVHAERRRGRNRLVDAEVGHHLAGAVPPVLLHGDRQGQPGLPLGLADHALVAQRERAYPGRLEGDRRRIHRVQRWFHNGQMVQGCVGLARRLE